MEIECSSRSAFETKKIGRILGQELRVTKDKQKAHILGLKGDLGGGKTTFLQGLAKGLGIKEKVLSPTFVILKKFEIPTLKRRDSIKSTRGQVLKFKNFYHIDCYRVKNRKEIDNLALEEIINCPQNIVAIEWAARLAKILPKDTIFINFKFISKEKRKIIFSWPKKNGS